MELRDWQVRTSSTSGQTSHFLLLELHKKNELKVGVMRSRVEKHPVYGAVLS